VDEHFLKKEENSPAPSPRDTFYSFLPETAGRGGKKREEATDSDSTRRGFTTGKGEGKLRKGGAEISCLYCKPIALSRGIRVRVETRREGGGGHQRND